MLGFPAGAGGPPPPPRQKDGIEMVGDPATFHHVALDIPVVDRKSDGHTAAAVGEIHPAYGEHQQFENCLTEDCLTWCAKTMFKVRGYMADIFGYIFPSIRSMILIRFFN